LHILNIPYTSRCIELAFTSLIIFYSIILSSLTLSISLKSRFFFRYYHGFSFPAKYSVGEALPMRSRDPMEMYICVHMRDGKCHYRVLAISRSHEAHCFRNAKPASIGSITRRSGNLMRLISVSIGCIGPAAGKHVYNHAGRDKAGFAKRSSLHFLHSICERQWFTALGSLIIHAKLENTNYPLQLVRERSNVRQEKKEIRRNSTSLVRPNPLRGIDFQSLGG